MKVTQEQTEGVFTIHAYHTGGITVSVPLGGTAAGPDGGQMLLTESFIIGAQTLLTDWPPQRLEELQADHFAPVVERAPEVFLLGSGPSLRFPAPAVVAPLAGHGIGVETMDSRAACRTFNILVAEGRRCLAAILQA